MAKAPSAIHERLQPNDGIKRRHRGRAEHVCQSLPVRVDYGLHYLVYYEISEICNKHSVVPDYVAFIYPDRNIEFNETDRYSTSRRNRKQKHIYRGKRAKHSDDNRPGRGVIWSFVAP